MRLVEQDHRLHHVVQLAAGTGPVGKQRFEQLDIGGQHDGGIPVLGEQPALAFSMSGLVALALIVLGVVFHAQAGHGMMFQYIALAELGMGSEDRAVYAGSLFNDSEIGHGQNDPLQAMLGRMGQGEGEHGERLAAAGWSSEGVVSNRPGCTFQTGSQQLLACLRYGADGDALQLHSPNVGQYGLQGSFGIQLWAELPVALAATIPLEVGFGIEKVRVYQT